MNPKDELKVAAARMLSPEEVARRCGLSRRAVYDAIRRGELRAVRLCSRLRIDPQAFESWLASNAVRASQSPRLRDEPSTLPALGGSFRALMDRGTRETG